MSEQTLWIYEAPLKVGDPTTQKREHLENIYLEHELTEKEILALVAKRYFLPESSIEIEVFDGDVDVILPHGVESVA